jgi:cell wall-associated NlpC family hydrolase
VGLAVGGRAGAESAVVRSLRLTTALAPPLALLLLLAAAVWRGPDAAAADPYRWATRHARPLSFLGAWSQPVGDLGRPATRGAAGRVLRTIAMYRGADAPPPAVARLLRVRPRAPLQARDAAAVAVALLGLEEERRALSRLTAGDVPLRLPRGFAVEVLAREAGLRRNYPGPVDGAERSGREAISRADLAWLARRLLAFSPEDAQALAVYRDIRLPAVPARVRRVIESALGTVGTPYVWGGEWPGTASPGGWQAHAGFDCSGLVWWAFRGAVGQVAWTLIGRQTADSLAFGRAGPRLPLRRMRAGDLVFFGPRGPRTRRGRISHVAIALGGGFIVQSSGSRAGTSVTHLSGFWPDGAAFARRPWKRAS